MSVQFDSYPFIFVFLPLTVGVFWKLLRHLGRNHAVGWLLFASVIFYASASLRSLAIVVPSILVDYGFAQGMLRQKYSARTRKALLICGICLNVLFLGYFKYKNFFIETVNGAAGTDFVLTPALLPVGISFLVFQKIAFLIDVHSEQLQTVRLLDFLLFTLFFPRTIAGPIVHYQEVIPQLSAAPPDGAKRAVAVGLCLFSIGLFKKTVLADNIGKFVPFAFDKFPDAISVGSTGLLFSWISVLAYAFQLYFDFSGYSDMALGSARMLGIQLPINFNSPFKANSMVDFWSRWHITLTRFLTAYIYTPIVLHLTRSRMAKGKPILCAGRTRFSALMSLVATPTLTTMTISGLWHGAGWQFIAWGALHGIYLTVNQTWRLWERRLRRSESRHDRVSKILAHLLTFMSVVVSLVLFRSDSLATAKSVLSNMLGLNGLLPHFLELVEKTGVIIPWPMWNILLPWTAFCLIAISLIIVMWLPNSLECVSSLESAFVSSRAETLAVSNDVPNDVSSLIRRRFAALAAPATALMSALGVMAISQSSGFLYGAF